MAVQRILGIDPGLQKTGWGVIEIEGNRLTYVACGLIKPKATEDLANRLAFLHSQFSEIVQQFKPGRAAIEETFVNNNPQSTLKLGQARGVVMAVPALHGISVAEYSPNKIKKSVVGAGHADKNQIQAMIKILLPTCGQVSSDEADALAVAITHAHYKA